MSIQFFFFKQIVLHKRRRDDNRHICLLKVSIWGLTVNCLSLRFAFQQSFLHRVILDKKTKNCLYLAAITNQYVKYRCKLWLQVQKKFCKKSTKVCPKVSWSAESTNTNIIRCLCVHLLLLYSRFCLYPKHAINIVYSIRMKMKLNFFQENHIAFALRQRIM